MKYTLRPALVLFIALSLVTGLAYPLLVTAIGQLAFPSQANGSLMVRDGRAVGSALIGQSFSDPAHFWSRPSATTPKPYDASNSAGSNLGPMNPALIDAVEARVAALRAVDPVNTVPVPVDLVTASASGLDPDISLAAANFQVPRVARVTGLSKMQVQALVDAQARGALFGFIGEPRVNVLALNLTLDALRRTAPAQ